jgi:hypothetical protein
MAPDDNARGGLKRVKLGLQGQRKMKNLTKGGGGEITRAWGKKREVDYRWSALFFCILQGALPLAQCAFSPLFFPDLP